MHKGEHAPHSHAHPHPHTHEHTHAHPHGHEHSHAITADGARVPHGTVIEPGHIAPDPTQRHTAHIDVSCGASGDMLLGAFIDAGADTASIAAVLDAIAPGVLRLQTRTVTRGAFAVRKVDVLGHEENPPARTFADITAMLQAAPIPPRTREIAHATFLLIAEAESAAHGTSIEDVHFHEIGALDSIGDIVGVAEAIRTLGINAATCSTVALGAGTVNTAHGLLPVPAPAVLELTRGWRVEAGGDASVGELCTPTGIALLKVLCTQVESLPQMTITATGTAAGSKDRTDRPNVVRVLIGDDDSCAVTPPSDEGDDVTLIECNIDDCDPRFLPRTLEQLMSAGALDAWLTPILMKKGRAAHTLSALVRCADVEKICSVIFANTPTLGVRIQGPMRRRTLQRKICSLECTFGTARVKLRGDGAVITGVSAEYEDIAAIASATGKSLENINAQVLADARALMWYPGASWPKESSHE